MKIGQKLIIKRTLAAVIGWTMVASFAASLNAGIVNSDSVIVTDVTDWGTTPMEIVNVNDPLLNYYGGVYAGINTLEVTVDGSSTINNAFCIDPFHFSASGPTSGYSIVPLADSPKSPGTLNAATALDIEDLWAEYYSPTMSSAGAAGLQIAIWELVSANAVATGELPANEAFSVTSYDYGASADLASLATYDGPAANLTGLTGPGQDYVIDPPSVPDGGKTFFMLALTLGALVLARPAIIKSASLKLKPCKIRHSKNP
jgi:hypothetical protein